MSQMFADSGSAGESEWSPAETRSFCQAHNLKVVGSNPAPANKNAKISVI